MKSIFDNCVKKRFFVLAVLLRLLVIPFFFHPDIKVYHYQASFLRSGVLNIYSHLEQNKDNLLVKEQFVYFPLAYVFLGVYQAVVSVFLGSNFNKWLSGGIMEAAASPYVFRYLFFLKLPNLTFDLLAGFFLVNLSKNRKIRERLFVLWFFNPFTLALVYFYSNIDIFPVFFTVLSLYFLKSKKSLLAGLSLALGAGFKACPVLLLPALFLTNEKFVKQLKILPYRLLLYFSLLPHFLGEDFYMALFHLRIIPLIGSYYRFSFCSCFPQLVDMYCCLSCFFWQRKIFGDLLYFCLLC